MDASIKRGETLRIYLDDPDGLAARVTAIAADLRPGTVWPHNVSQSSPAVATLEVERREAEGHQSGGWTFTLGPEATLALPVRSLVIDARLTLDSGDVVVTEAVALRVIEPATVRPS